MKSLDIKPRFAIVCRDTIGHYWSFSIPEGKTILRVRVSSEPKQMTTVQQHFSYVEQPLCFVSEWEVSKQWKIITQAPAEFWQHRVSFAGSRRPITLKRDTLEVRKLHMVTSCDFSFSLPKPRTSKKEKISKSSDANPAKITNDVLLKAVSVIEKMELRLTHKTETREKVTWRLHDIMPLELKQEYMSEIGAYLYRDYRYDILVGEGHNLLSKQVFTRDLASGDALVAIFAEHRSGVSILSLAIQKSAVI